MIVTLTVCPVHNIAPLTTQNQTSDRQPGCVIRNHHLENLIDTAKIHFGPELFRRINISKPVHDDMIWILIKTKNGKPGNI